MVGVVGKGVNGLPKVSVCQSTVLVCQRNFGKLKAQKITIDLIKSLIIGLKRKKDGQYQLAILFKACGLGSPKFNIGDPC